MSIADLFFSVFWTLLLSGSLYHVYALVCVLEFFRTREQDSMPVHLPPVSVLKPMKGMDPEFRDNLETFIAQDHPEYELLLGFLEQDDGAAEQVRKLIRPDIEHRVRVIVSSDDVGSNRKVSNLQGLVRHARYPLLVLSDSDIRVERDYLRKIVREFQSAPNAGMVTNLYKISAPRSMGAAFESLTFALDVIPSVLMARRLEGVTFGLGASMLISKKGLVDIGGMRAIADYLADDYQLGNRLWKKGYSVVLSRTVLESVAGNMTVAEYIAHQVRWGRTYRTSRPKGFAGYGITHILPFALVLMVLQGPALWTLTATGLVLFLRYAQAAVIYKKVIRSRQWLKWLPLLPVKDILSLAFWAWSFLGSTVRWRGRTYRILRGGKMEEA